MDTRQSSASSMKTDAKSESISSRLSLDRARQASTSPVQNKPQDLDQEAHIHTKEHIADKTTISTIPNGGFTAWLQVVSGFMCFMNAWGMVNAYVQNCVCDYSEV